MKKTITINISGVIFNIEEDAYDVLRRYLDKLGQNFTDSDGKDEIIADIEARIAELFQERLGDRKEVISQQDVDQVMSIMGKPEDLGMEAEEEEGAGRSTYSRTQKRRVYRDTDKGVIGGVCAGISHYFGWDPIWMRIILLVVLLGFGIGFLLYILAWIIIPAARTTAEKLEMRGEPVNVETIKKKVTETFDQVREKTNVDTEFHYQHARTQFSKGSDALVDVLKRLVRFIGRIIGFVFLVVGLLSVTAIFSAWLAPGLIDIGGKGWNMQWADINTFLFDSPMLGYLFTAGVLAVTIIPLIALVIVGLKLLFSMEFKTKLLAATLVTLWIIGLGITIVTSVSLGKEFSQDGDYVERRDLMLQSDSLRLTLTGPYNTYDWDEVDGFNAFNDHFIFKEGDEVICRYPSVDIRRSEDDSSASIEILKSAQGFTEGAALRRAENIRYIYNLSDEGDLSLSSYFIMPFKDRFRAQDCEIEVLIPDGMTIFISEELQGILDDVDQVEYHRKRDLVGRYWIMTPDGLKDPNIVEEIQVEEV
jgi:phage shock protein PspC (stress-responsive transcriptional regulator)